MRPSFRGCGTALVTPFSASGAVDFPALSALVEWQVQEGVDFLVPCGSTGEAHSLDAGERRAVVECTVAVAAGRAAVIGGVSGNATAQVVEEARSLSQCGVDAVMVVTPYYNKPTQAGMEQHFLAVAEAAHCPVLIYTVPSRTGVRLAPETLLRLASHPNILGVKDSTGDLHWAMQVIRDRPEGFRVLSGEDGLALPHLACGGDGLISVAANVVPETMVRLVRAGLEGRFEEARTLQLAQLPLFDALFAETNPIPVKAAFALVGRGRSDVRLPLLAAQPETETRLRECLGR
jgi:4-hydroxy-tetrahydrodipicolinate synthase